MTANTSPIFTLTPVVSHVAISTANTNRDGTGTIGTVLTAGTNGTRINRIVVQATGTTTAGMVRIYLDIGGGAKLRKEIPVSAITPSASAIAFTYTLTLSGEDAWILPSGAMIKASTHNAESFNVFAEGGDY